LTTDFSLQTPPRQRDYPDVTSEALSNAQIGTIISSLTLGIMLLDQTGQICYANPAAADLLDAPSAAALLHTPILQWLPAIADELARAYAQTVLRTPVRAPSTPSSNRMLAIELLPVTAVLPSNARVVVVVRDATIAATPAEISERQMMRYAEDLTIIYAEERRARERLEEANRELKRAAAEREILYCKLQDRETRLRSFTEQLLDSQEAEHKRVAADLHDGLAQMIVSIHQHLQACLRLVSEEPASTYLAQASALAREASQEVRRLLANLRPPMLDDFGLVAALERHLASVAENTGWATEFIVEGIQHPLSFSIETAAFRIFQEILTNIRKHAHATTVEATVSFSEELFCLSVADNGCGFDPAATTNGMPISGQQIGLWGMRERASLLNGSVELTSVPGHGTRVTVRIPIPPDAKQSEATQQPA